jgi:hypothetical protein
MLAVVPAFAADNAIVLTPGAGVTERSIDVGGLIQAPGIVPVGINGASAWSVTPGTSNPNILTVQGIAAMTPFLVTATQSGTWNIGTVTTVTAVTGITNPVASTQSGNWTTRNVGNAGAILDFPGQNAAAPANAFLMGGEFNTTPTVITTGNASPLQLDTNGNLLVNVKAGGAGGGAITAAASSYAATAFSVGAGTDGWDATQGTKADAAWTSGSGSTIAVLKAIDRDVLTPATLTPTSVAGNAVTAVTCPSGTSVPCQLKSSPGNFYGAYANCSAACWLFVINTTTLPVNATLTTGTASGNLVDCIPIAAGLASSVSYPTFPRNYSVGIYMAISSTACPVLTLAATGTLYTGQAQ